MPRDGATTFRDLIGKLDLLRVSCDKCGRAGRYRVQHLIDEHGRDGKIVDWLDEIAVECPKRATGMSDVGRGAVRPVRSLRLTEYEAPGTERKAAPIAF